jgi:hypothetical protein
MKAVKCPVCGGRGRLDDPASTVKDGRTCHGCGGGGWVAVPEYPAGPGPRDPDMPWPPPGWEIGASQE